MAINGGKQTELATGDFSVVLYANNLITYIVFTQVMGSTPITNLRIGTTPGGNEIYEQASLIPQKAYYINEGDQMGNFRLTERYFSRLFDTEIFISATWNGASLGMTVNFDPATEN